MVWKTQAYGWFVRVVGWPLALANRGVAFPPLRLLKRVETLRLQGKGQYLTPPPAAYFQMAAKPQMHLYAPWCESSATR